MTDKLKEISKQKFAIIVAVLVISSIWGAVLFWNIKYPRKKSKFLPSIRKRFMSLFTRGMSKC